jgi:hypothetical protein
MLTLKIVLQNEELFILTNMYIYYIIHLFQYFLRTFILLTYVYIKILGIVKFD